MRFRAVLIPAMCAALGGCGACEPERTIALDAAPPASPAIHVIAASASVLVNSGGPNAGPINVTGTPCRATAVDGEVRAALVGGADTPADAGTMLALQAQGEVPRDAWLWLATGARLVAKDPRTTRETTFLGPAHARACVDGREESWIAYGSLESVAGAGEAPGAEEWLVTPLAVVRYGAARLRVDVGGSNTSVAMASGVAFLSIAGDARAKRQRGDAAASAAEDGSWPEADPGWQRVDEGVVTVVPAVARPPVDAARSVVDACYSVAGRARDLAGALLSGADASPDSTVLAASEQVSTRRRARAACAMAGLRVRLLAASNARSSLLGKINEAEEAWRALPIVSPTP